MILTYPIIGIFQQQIILNFHRHIFIIQTKQKNTQSSDTQSPSCLKMNNQPQQTQMLMLRPLQVETQTPSSMTINDGNLLLSKSIERGRQSRFQFQKFLNIDFCLLMFCVTNVILSLLYYDADYQNKKDISSLCLKITDFMSVMQIFVTVVRYQTLVNLQKSQKILDEQQGLYSSGKIPKILLQISLLLIQPYSFFEDLQITTQNVKQNFSFNYKINYILVVMGFAKIFIPIRVLLLRQLYMSPRCQASRLCRMYGCQSNYLYAIKCLFKDSPLCLIGLVFAISIIIFAISLRIAERNLIDQYKNNHLDLFDHNIDKIPEGLDQFQNALWLTIITMTTVGYGDFFPKTVFGRFIDVFLVIWGTFIVSLMVVVLTNTLNMDQSQKRALIVLNRLQTKKTLKQAAAFVITHSCRKYLINKKVQKRLRPPLSQQQRIKLQSSFYKYLSNFQNIHRKIRSMYEIDDVYQEMTRQFQFINDQVSVLLASQEETISNIHIYIGQEKAKKVDVGRMVEYAKGGREGSGRDFGGWDGSESVVIQN